MKKHLRPFGIALIYGTLAGAIAATVYLLMQQVLQLLWSHRYSHQAWYIFAVIMTGGVLLAWAQHARQRGGAVDGNLQQQLETLHQPADVQRRDMALIALSAVVAVGFGGAVGPEAALLAVVAECSAWVAVLLTASYQEQRLIRDTGAVAALSGLYGAPTGAAVLVDERADSIQAAESTPLVVKFVAGVCGLLGFWWVLQTFSESHFQKLPLPEHIAAGSDALWALPAALGGMLLGLGYRVLHHQMTRFLKRFGSVPRQIVLASALFATLAACFPLLRFSGHHELEYGLTHGLQWGVWALLALAVGKILVMTLCLAGGWRGGEFFPAIFAAAALASALHLLFPSLPLGVSLVAAASACATVCMGKPIAVLLTMLLFFGNYSPSALFVGILLGYAGVRWTSSRD